MRVLVYIVVVISFPSFGQGWRDSLELARTAYKKGNYSEALDYYEKIQKTKPKSVDLSDEMGQSAYKAREYERAEKIYQQSAGSKKAGSERSKTYHNLGNSRMKSKDYGGAIDEGSLFLAEIFPQDQVP